MYYERRSSNLGSLIQGPRKIRKGPVNYELLRAS